MLDSGIAEAIQRMAIFAVPLLLGVTCHEVAHGYVAHLHGDPTAKNAGRLTLNPLKHLDVTGTLVFVLTSLFSPFVIGWAKPVPVDPRYFRNPRKGMLLVALAGPSANFLLALFFAILTKLFVALFLSAQTPAATFLDPLLSMALAGIFINLVLGLFNLLPVPPLDGSKIVLSILPRDLAVKYARVERYGMLILILLLATGILGEILFPVLKLLLAAVVLIFGFPPSMFFQ